MPNEVAQLRPQIEVTPAMLEIHERILRLEALGYPTMAECLRGTLRRMVEDAREGKAA